MTSLKIAAIAAALLGFAGPAMAANVDVHMMNKGEDGLMVFEPSAIKIAPGDTVTFVPVNKGHDAETIPGLLPDGATPFKGKISQPITVTFDVPGLYGVKCMPHFALGMVALVEVGNDPANIDAIKTAKLPKKARERMDAELEKLGF
jgi:pseudoazurin